MQVGICTIKIHLFEVGSLKEKRHIVKSVIERVKARFNVSIAEVGEMDKWQLSEIGFSCVSNSRTHAEDILNKVIHFIEGDGRFEISDWSLEVI